MSKLLTKTEGKASAVAGAMKESSVIKDAGRLLYESGMDKKCPHLVKMMESEEKASKLKAATMVQLVENTRQYILGQQRVDILTEDATLATAALNPGVATLTPRVLDVVNVFYPTMIAQHVADIHALDRQSSVVFTIKTRYGEEAAGISEGDIVFEKVTDGSYASEWIFYNSATIAGSVTLNPTATLDTQATVVIRAGSVRVFLGGKEIARDYGDGNVIGKGILNTSVVNYTTGVITLDVDTTYFADAIAANLKVSAQSSYDTETDTKLIRELDFDILPVQVMAQEHPLMQSYSVAAGLVANAHLALDVDELISNQLAGTIRWERDLRLINMVHDAAKAQPELLFDCQGNGTNLTLKQRYSAFDVMVSTARGLIQKNAGRGNVEFIIVSAEQGLTIVEQVDGFVASPESKKPIGPYLAGTLREGNIAVIAVPYSGMLGDDDSSSVITDEVIYGFKGFQAGDSAVIVAEWIPLYFTPTFQAPNLKNTKGCLSFYDMLINKPEYLVKGGIANFNLS